MNANAIIDDSMSLEDKLAAIDKAMQEAQAQNLQKATDQGQVVAPLDPADLTMCLGCQ